MRKVQNVLKDCSLREWMFIGEIDSAERKKIRVRIEERERITIQFHRSL